MGVRGSWDFDSVLFLKMSAITWNAISVCQNFF